MDSIIKLIDDRIKELKADINKYCKIYDIETAEHIQMKISELEWIKSEIQKMNCKSCSRNYFCNSSVEEAQNETSDITYCSNWSKQ